jgi:hypothetical protein
MTSDLLQLGASDEAQLVGRKRRDNDAHLTSSATFSKNSAYEQLNDVWKDCRHQGWDGGDAVAIEQLTYTNAYRLVEALPLGYPLPSAGAEPDGHLTLEWHRDPKWTFSVSISPEGTLHYAGLFGSDDPRGSSTFVGEVPNFILFLIQRVSQQ